MRDPSPLGNLFGLHLIIKIIQINVAIFAQAALKLLQLNSLPLCAKVSEIIGTWPTSHVPRIYSSALSTSIRLIKFLNQNSCLNLPRK